MYFFKKTGIGEIYIVSIDAAFVVFNTYFLIFNAVYFYGRAIIQFQIK
jgi:hypothetical protein